MCIPSQWRSIGTHNSKRYEEVVWYTIHTFMLVLTVCCLRSSCRSVWYHTYIYTTIAGVCKWVFTTMSFSSRADAIRQRSSPKSQVIFAFVFSWIGDLFVFFGLIYLKLRRVCLFWVEMHAATLILQPLKQALRVRVAMRVSPLYYDSGPQVAHSGWGYWVVDADTIIFNRGRSVASWTFTGRVFHHAERPVERAPA